MTKSGFASHFRVGSRAVGPGEPCLIIAEAGVNHFGSLEKAFRLVDLAKQSGADIVKFQHFKTDLLVSHVAPDWRERLRSKELSDDQLIEIKDYADAVGMEFLCTPHDESAFALLRDRFDLGAFKIGSGEVENWGFLEQVARVGKPVILSTGMYDLDQVRCAIQVLGDAGCTELALLHCVTSYPTPPNDVHLRAMEELRSLFPGPIGYSDHTTGIAVPLAAVALGAHIVEKHITLDRDVPNAQDWKVSCDATTLPAFVAQVREIEAALGVAIKTRQAIEENAFAWARKSLCLRTFVPSGTCLGANDLVAQRPGTGISPARIAEFVGRRTVRDLAVGEMLNVEDLEQS